ncbi:DUF551 domain-containing protein [Raoultella ornithinolytica]|uniref:DUF551 domain-containing protein n=1 Tax=Raoultella ornithinolytica TaxID=54291 RepID=UPI003D36C0BD
MSFETLLPCPFCGGEPEEDAWGCIEYHGHEHQDYSITCKQCGAEVYCSVGTFEKADVPCSCHYDTRKVCVDKWNKRAAMIQAGNSAVIPDGYVLVPREPTEEMNKAGWAAMNEHDAINPTYRAMIAAAAHDTPALNSVQSVATVPGKWVPVSERMPETDGNYWGWWSESKRQGPVWFIKSELQAQFQSHEITHWMPLPADPQEVKGES